MTRVSGAASSLSNAIGATAALALISTLGDWIWARFLTDGSVIAGLVHGVVFFAVLAVVSALSCPRPIRALKRLLAMLPTAGMLIAAAFYPLARALGYLTALLLCWILMWIALAFAYRAASDRAESRGRTFLRAIVAAVTSGLVFWLVSGMWTNPPADGPNLVGNCVRWFVAFLPGMVALIYQSQVASVRPTPS